MPELLLIPIGLIVLAILSGVVYLILRRKAEMRMRLKVGFSVVVVIALTAGAVAAFLMSQFLASQAPAPTTGLTPEDELRSFASDLTRGAIAAEIPPEATQGERFIVKVEIIRAVSEKVNEAITRFNREHGYPIAEELTTGASMYVDLKSPDEAFDIKQDAPNARYQYVSFKEPSVWIFQVTPTKSGSHDLIVYAGVDAMAGGMQTTIHYDPFQKTVSVKVSPVFWLRIYWAVLSEPVISAVVAGIASIITYFVGAWWNKRRKRKKRAKQAASTAMPPAADAAKKN
jgi:hypothetical protein